MMEVDKPWDFKEEVDIMEEEEDAAGVLQTRQRKKKPMDLDLGQSLSGHGNDGDEAQALEEEHNKSIFFDPTKVSDHVTEVSAEKEVIEVVQFGGEKENTNETSSAEGKELEKQENVNAQETNRNSRTGKLENGSHSNGVHEDSSSSETVTIADRDAGLKLIATIGESKTDLTNWSGALGISNGSTNRTKVHEIEVEKDEHVTKGKVNIEEYDLEKILDEQETHDLYCPKCNSCITRRVILRKRKRTVKQAIRDEPPKKPQLAEPSASASIQTAAERQDQDSPDVFRCLSCFTFFTPTGCGFYIFRIFERRDVNQQVQDQDPSVSRHMSENCGSWLLSCFQTVDSPKKSADADPAKKPLLSDTPSTNVTTPSIEANTSSAHSGATIGEAEHFKKPLPAAKNEEEIKQSSSSVTVHTSSSTTSKISSSWQSETGFMHTETRHMVTGQQDIARQEQILLSKPAGDVVTDAIHLDRKEDIKENTTAASENSSFFNQAFFNSAVKVPTASPTKVLSEVGNLTVEKPTSVIPQPIQCTPPHLALHVPVIPVPAQRDEWDILKAIVYGGLVESITSLSVVSAAAASGAKTLDIFILGIANLIGGLPIIYHNIVDLRDIGDVDENDELVGHYWLQLGRRSKYQLHMFIAILSYILFGLLPPVIYGLSFRKSDNRENKMMVVAAASLACIALIAIGKAHVKRPRTYITTLLYYLSIGLSCSGLSYIAGVLITRLLAHFGLIDQGASPPAPPSLLFPDAMGREATAWASY
ncbi:membrane protein of ER body 2-like [Phragmites australis]|uniref:membrane protein of ER body 2-like n=1 Tax=Phragmites australis TaxID=29695 RepID=UPI002D78D3B0|nr:membrane protein of ER body 2-like [Phragmites australis]